MSQQPFGNITFNSKMIFRNPPHFTLLLYSTLVSKVQTSSRHEPINQTLSNVNDTPESKVQT